MFHDGLTDVSIALIALIVTGIGIFIALLFNIKAIRQNSKNQQYQMKKDFYEKFHEIQSIPHSETAEYVTKMTNFALMVWDLHIDGIVKKETITSDLEMIFQHTVWFYTESNIEGQKPDPKFLKWCKENGIVSKKPSRSRMEYLKSKSLVAYFPKETQTDNTETTKEPEKS